MWFQVLVAMGEKSPQIDFTGEKLVSTAYEIAGSKFTYRREGDKEAIAALGPIKDKIMVKVRVVHSVWELIFKGPL